MADDLLDETTLTASSVVANRAMNRERQLTGVNSYARELGFDPVEGLIAARAGAWLDLCCGSGRPLVQAAERIQEVGLAPRVAVVGVDLIGDFPARPDLPGLTLVAGSVVHWAPDRTFDLITCVHGLHYVGDKLGVLARAAGWLAPRGRLVADLDVSSVLGPTRRALLAWLRGSGFAYDPRKRRVSRTGSVELTVPFEYLGADAYAGPNYTGQPAVDSHYR